jgi:hypothetical protein
MKTSKQLSGRVVLGALLCAGLSTSPLDAVSPVQCDGPCNNLAVNGGSCTTCVVVNGFGTCPGAVIAQTAYQSCGGAGFLLCTMTTGVIGTSTPCAVVESISLEAWYYAQYLACSLAGGGSSCDHYMNPCNWTTCVLDPTHATSLVSGVFQSATGTPCPPNG